MNKESIISYLSVLKSFLFKTFIISLPFAIILFALTATFWDLWSSFVFAKFQVPEKELGGLVVNSFLHLRLFLIFIVLVPAISLHWLIKSIKQ